MYYNLLGHFLVKIWMFSENLVVVSVVFWLFPRFLYLSPFSFVFMLVFVFWILFDAGFNFIEVSPNFWSVFSTIWFFVVALNIFLLFTSSNLLLLLLLLLLLTFVVAKLIIVELGLSDVKFTSCVFLTVIRSWFLFFVFDFSAVGIYLLNICYLIAKLFFDADVRMNLLVLFSFFGGACDFEFLVLHLFRRYYYYFEMF